MINMPASSQASNSPILIHPFWGRRYPLVAPQRVGPWAGMPLAPLTVAPAGMLLQEADRLRRLRPLRPREEREDWPERGGPEVRGVGPRLVKVLQGENEHRPL